MNKKLQQYNRYIDKTQSNEESYSKSKWFSTFQRFQKLSLCTAANHFHVAMVYGTCNKIECHALHVHNRAFRYVCTYIWRMYGLAAKFYARILCLFRSRRQPRNRTCTENFSSFCSSVRGYLRWILPDAAEETIFREFSSRWETDSQARGILAQKREALARAFSRIFPTVCAAYVRTHTGNTKIPATLHKR